MSILKKVSAAIAAVTYLVIPLSSHALTTAELMAKAKNNTAAFQANPAAANAADAMATARVTAAGQPAPAIQPGQRKVTIVTGASDASYSLIYNNLVTVCKPDLPVVFAHRNTGGTLDNIDLFNNNQAGGGFFQLDTAVYMSKLGMDLSGMRTLFYGPQEQIHVVVSNRMLQSGGVSFMGKTWGGSQAQLTDFNQLRSKPVAAWGGGWATAKIIADNGGVPFSVAQAADRTDAFAKLDRGEVQGLIATGAAPITWVTNLDPTKYHLVSINPQMAANLDAVGAYTRTSVTYTKLGANSLATLQVPSVFMVRNFTSPQMSASLLNFANCVKGNASDMSMTEGMHPGFKSMASQVNAKPHMMFPAYTGQ